MNLYNFFKCFVLTIIFILELNEVESSQQTYRRWVLHPKKKVEPINYSKFKAQSRPDGTVSILMSVKLADGSWSEWIKTSYLSVPVEILKDIKSCLNNGEKNVLIRSITSPTTHPNYKGQFTFTSKKRIPKPIDYAKFKAQSRPDGTVSILMSVKLTGDNWSEWIKTSHSSIPHEIIKEIKSALNDGEKEVLIHSITDPDIPLNPQLDFDSSQEDSQEDSEDSSMPEIPSTIETKRLYTWKELESDDSQDDSYIGNNVDDIKHRSPSIEGVINLIELPRTQRQHTKYIPRPSRSQSQIREVRTRFYPSPRANRDVSNFRIPFNTQDQESNISTMLEHRLNPIKIRPDLRNKVRLPSRGFSKMIELRLDSPNLERNYLPKELLNMKPKLEVPEIKVQNLSVYELTRMQWKYFFSIYNPSMDNVRIIKRIPPLGFKLSKSVSECNLNFLKAFELGFLSVSGIMYSKKIKRSMMNSINRELKQWCNGMMARWNRQLERMEINLQKKRGFIS